MNEQRHVFVACIILEGGSAAVYTLKRAQPGWLACASVAWILCFFY